MQRHVKELHDEDCPREVRGQKKYICPETGCGKAFKYPSKLRKHEDSHVKLDYVEVICGEHGCMKHFTNEECLKAHIQSCHQHIQCPTCGTKQLKKNLKRHLCIHEKEGCTEKIKCSFRDCLHTFSNKSNLNKHVKAVHLELRPFTCRVSGCGQKFPYKHVRDNHEKCGAHTFTQGDFLEADAQFRSRPRGGRKRKCVMVESLLRKRIAASPDETNMLPNGTHYISQILGDDEQ
uniref:Transcription factor IIIA n=2 Tax=Anthurium amnicola TaxID=1678845 RepID=A0A1D1Z0F9_9ARAE